MAETNPFWCTHTFFKKEIYGPLTSHCRRCGEASSQQHRWVDPGRPHSIPPRTLCLGKPLERRWGYTQSQKHGPKPPVGGLGLNSTLFGSEELTTPIQRLGSRPRRPFTWLLRATPRPRVRQDPHRGHRGRKGWVTASVLFSPGRTPPDYLCSRVRATPPPLSP